MRDPDPWSGRWNEKVELSLDGRQIFFLFFGSAVSVCLIFVAGVFVGKRIEQRALALSPPVVEDPLAALDQIDNEEADDGLTFPEALAHEQKKHPLAEGAKAEPIVLHAAPGAVAPSHPAASPPAAPHTAIPPAAHAAAPAVPAHKSPPSPSPIKKPDEAAAKAPPRIHEPAEATGASVPPAPHTAAPERYTLQLSSFATEDDAEAFARKVRTAGFEPHVVESTIPGKGTFFRVRAGEFSSRAEAAAAQSEYQRKQNASAYIAAY